MRLVSGINFGARSPKLRKGQNSVAKALIWPFRNFGDLATLVIPETNVGEIDNLNIEDLC